MNEQEIYVDNDLLGQQILFRSATGERLGFFNSRIVSMLDFAEDRLNIRTAPKNYEKVREIRYKDIASVDVKRHMSILYIILFILLAIGAIFSMGITLVIWKQIGYYNKIRKQIFFCNFMGTKNLSRFYGSTSPNG